MDFWDKLMIVFLVITLAIGIFVAIFGIWAIINGMPIGNGLSLATKQCLKITTGVL